MRANARHVAVLFGLTACAGPGPYEGWTPVTASTGEFRVHAPMPPWRVTRREGAVVELQVASAGASIVPDLAIPPKYDLTVSVLAGSVAELVTLALEGGAERGESVLDGPRALETARGDAGQEFLTTTADLRSRRYVYLPDPLLPGSVVHAFLDAAPSTDEPEVDLLVRGIDPAPERR